MIQGSLRVVLTSLVVATFHTSLVVQANLDLYVRERFQRFPDGVAESCDSCDGRDGCVPNRALYVQGQCLRENRTSRRGRVYEGDDEKVCRNDYDDETCQNLLLTCSQEWPTNQCDAPLEMTRYVDHCIQSDGPSGEFTTQVVLLSRYNDLDSCMAGVDATEGLVPSDPQLCVSPIAASVDGNITKGSTIFSCSENVLTTQIFSDSFCTEQDGLDDPPSWDRSMDCMEDPDTPGVYWTADCSYSLYCKDLYQTNFAFQIQDEPTGTTEPAPVGGAPTASPDTSGGQQKGRYFVMKHIEFVGFVFASLSLMLMF